MFSRNVKLILALLLAIGFTCGLAGAVFAVNSAPYVASVYPESATFQQKDWQYLECTYYDVDGITNLNSMYLLINTAVNANGAEFMYNQNTNRLYMYSMATGTATIIPSVGVVPGSSTIIETEYAYLDCSRTTVWSISNEIHVRYCIQLKPRMAGYTNRIYAYVKDDYGANSGWRNIGPLICRFGNLTPTIGSAVASSTTCAPEAWVTISCYFADPNTRKDLNTCRLIVNTSASAVGGGYFVYNPNENKLYIINNVGTLVGGVKPGTAKVLSTENAYLDCQTTTVEPASVVGTPAYSLGSTTMKVNFKVRFKAGMGGKTHGLYLRAYDVAGKGTVWTRKGTLAISSTAAIASYLAAAQSYLNQLITLSPYNPTTAKTLLTNAKNNFQAAWNLDRTNATANFGLSITTAALTAQSLIDKYQPLMATPDGRAGLKSLSAAVECLNFWNLSDNVTKDSPAGSFATAYTNMLQLSQATTNAVTASQLAAMQTDLKTTVIPMLQTVSNYLTAVEKDPSFTYRVGPATSADSVLVDIGDIYLFHGTMLIAKSVLALPASYSLNFGTFNTGLSDEQRDVNHDGVLVPSEYLPVDPFLTLASATLMTAVKTDMITACNCYIAGINSTLAEPYDDHELIPWHGEAGAELKYVMVSLVYEIQQLQKSFTAATVLQLPLGDYGSVIPVNVYLGAWSVNPPKNLKAFAPKFQLDRVYYYPGSPDYYIDKSLIVGSFPDTTFGGLFPDGVPDDFLYPSEGPDDNIY